MDENIWKKSKASISTYKYFIGIKKNSFHIENTSEKYGGKSECKKSFARG